jgi:hypothetical protein
MEVNDQGAFEFSVPQDIFWSKTLVEDAQRTYFLYGPRNRTLNGVVKGCMAESLATPAHKEHMTNFPRAVEEIDLGQINGSKKDWNCRSLGTLEDTVKCLLRATPPSRVLKWSLFQQQCIHMCHK